MYPLHAHTFTYRFTLLLPLPQDLYQYILGRFATVEEVVEFFQPNQVRDVV